MREVISVHVGQAGVQIGNACCKLRLHIPCPFPKDASYGVFQPILCMFEFVLT